MKLLVIVLCLLSERFLVNNWARFNWFDVYYNFFKEKTTNSLFGIILFVLPAVLITGFLFYLFGNWIFGLVGFILNVMIFYFALGANNPFYPLRSADINISEEQDARKYLANANGDVFAVIFWYVVLGPLAILTYRMISMLRADDALGGSARFLTDLFDWIPARLTALLYLLVGNFQSAIGEYSRLFFSSIKNNAIFLGNCGIRALGSSEPCETLPRAETLIEHAIIVLLVLMAFFSFAVKL